MPPKEFFLGSSMIAKSSILRNLKTLEKLYDASPGNRTGLLYSKLAILELCGWIEDTMDGMVTRSVTRRIKAVSVRDKFSEDVILHTYGFHYDKHFRQMLVYVIGEVTMLRVEKRLDQTKFQSLRSTLGSLRKSRDIQAHTHLRGGNRRLDSPLVTKANFFRVYDGLVEMESKLKALGY